MKNLAFILFSFLLIQCKQEKKRTQPVTDQNTKKIISHASGFSIEKINADLTVIKINSPWLNAESAFTYALVSKNSTTNSTINNNDYDAVIQVPVARVVVTSTTHIPALEALGEESKLIGFPGTNYISSQKTRKRVDADLITELGINETLNTEMVIALQPDVIIGFGIDSKNKAYNTIQKSNIPVVYNGDWTEETPLGKAEWIKFFAPFFKKEALAEQIFETTKAAYEDAKNIAKMTTSKPKVISGAMYKDVWYLPGGKSWAAQFLVDANADYIWQNSPETGSLSLSWEAVLEKGKQADFWIAPSQFSSYKSLAEASQHYQQFDAFKQKKIYTYANTKGETGGLLYYELAPQRPDLVLKDLIHILHPTLLPDYEPFFFKPLE